jgi:hypothetical protein
MPRPSSAAQPRRRSELRPSSPRRVQAVTAVTAGAADVLDRIAQEREKRNFVSSLFPHLRLMERSLVLPARSRFVPARKIRWDTQVHARMHERREREEIEAAREFSLETIGRTLAIAVDLAAYDDVKREAGEALAARRRRSTEATDEEAASAPAAPAAAPAAPPSEAATIASNFEGEEARGEAAVTNDSGTACVQRSERTSSQHRPPEAEAARGLRAIAHILSSGRYREAPSYLPPGDAAAAAEPPPAPSPAPPPPTVTSAAPSAPPAGEKDALATRTTSVLPLLRTALTDGDAISAARLSFRFWRRDWRDASDAAQRVAADEWVGSNKRLLEMALPSSVAFALATPSREMYATIADQLGFQARSEDRRQYVQTLQAEAEVGSLPMQRADAVWADRGGGELEPLLTPTAPHGAPLLALVDADWLIALSDSGQLLPRRQALPAKALVSLEALKRAVLTNHIGLPVLCLSHCWLSPSHPDPRGASLASLAAVLRAYTRSGDRWGVFIDYCGLPQPADAALELSASDAALLQAGVDSIGLLFSHPRTTVLRLTTLPADYPSAYELPEEANTAAFDKRGWTWTESAMAFMLKPSELSPDIGRWSGAFDFATGVIVEGLRGGGHPAPTTPQQFSITMLSKAFTRPEEYAARLLVDCS